MSDASLEQPNADLAAEANAALAAAPVDDVAAALAAPPIDAAKEAAENRAFLSSILGVTFNQALAPRLGTHWALKDSECSSLADAYATVLDKYFPNWRGGPELTAIIVTFGVLGPRAAQSYAQKREQQKNGTQQTDAAAGVDAAPT